MTQVLETPETPEVTILPDTTETPAFSEAQQKIFDAAIQRRWDALARPRRKKPNDCAHK